MDELLVVLGALVTLVLSIAGMNVYRWRTDVLTGPYISNRDHEQTISPTAEWTELTGQRRKEAHDAPLPAMLLALNEPRKSTRYSSNRARKATIHAGFGNGF
jgi:hypothetical protein